MTLEILRDEVQKLLRRRDVTCRFEKSNGFLTRQAAEKAVADALKVDAGKVYGIALKGGFGRMDLTGRFHIYEDDKEAARRVPKHIKMRRMPKEQRLKAKEAAQAAKTAAPVAKPAGAKGK